jgi:hypothetical protein
VLDGDNIRYGAALSYASSNPYPFFAGSPLQGWRVGFYESEDGLPGSRPIYAMLRASPGG